MSKRKGVIVKEAPKNEQQIFLVRNKDENELMKSQSGGIFKVIANLFIRENSCVYGCVLTEDMKIEHIRGTKIEEIEQMCGSKYVQSNLNDSLKKIKYDLENGKKVLFIGTPCQVGGVKNFLKYSRVDTANLTCIDLICHGVPSPGVWEKYKEYLNEKNNNIKNYNFRNKRYGWESSVATFECDGKEKINNAYNTLFFMHYIVRESCFECPYRNLNRCGDITIGDAWGLKDDNKFYDKRGNSLVLLNTHNGKDIFERVKENVLYEKVEIKEYMQPALYKNYNIPSKREKFWIEYNSRKFSYIAMKYGGENIIKKTKKKIKKIINKVKRISRWLKKGKRMQ